MSSFQMQSNEMLARLKPFGISFEKSLNDLIKGIRSHFKESPESLRDFLDNAIEECKNELTTTDLEVKATAVLKLAYLEMYGFDMSWCNFQILEIMSSSRFQQKRIGYLAAMQSFKNEKDLLILATNQFKKDLSSHNHIEIGLALSGIATIVTPNLAQDIVDDVLVKLTHSKPYIRKKAVLALFKIFLQYPESLRSSLPRVIEKLDDEDNAVVSATITVICEISKKNPNIFIAYLPKFFSILGETQNNWLIIRILKLFQSLSKVEPRMKKRILPSIITLMSKTDATSLVYESISCIVNGGMLSPDSSKDKEIAKECITHLVSFFVKGDANLRFVGLIALISILKIYPDFMHKVNGVSGYVMSSLEVKDTIVMKKALEVCQFLVTEDNILELIRVLLLQLVPDESSVHISENLKLEIVFKILQIASKDNYANIPNFNWYVTVLKDVVNMTLLPVDTEGSPNSAPALSKRASDIIARKLGAEFKNVATKVPSLRPYLMRKVVFEFVTDKRVLQYSPLLMRDIYWLMGEYVSELGITDDDSDEEDEEASNAALGYKIQMLNTIVNSYVDKKLAGPSQFVISDLLIKLPNPEVQITLIPALVKLYSDLVTEYSNNYAQQGKLPSQHYGQLAYFLFKSIKFLENFEQNGDYEVQERALSWLEFLRISMDAMGGAELPWIKKLESDEIAYYKTQVAKRVADNVDSDDEEDDTSDSDSESSSEETEDEDEEDEEELEEEESPKSEEDQSQVEAAQDLLDSSDQEIPHLLTSILPSFFKGYTLNPVAASAQKMIALPEDLDLDIPINTPPSYCVIDDDPLDMLYSDEESEDDAPSEKEDNTKNDEEATRERLERMKDDPFYITPSDKKARKQKSQLLQTPSEKAGSETPSEKNSLVSLDELAKRETKKSKKMKKHKVTVLSEESLGGDVPSQPSEEGSADSKKKKSNKLLISSSNLDNFDINSSPVEVAEGKADEYDVDLDALRQQLAEKEQKRQAKEARKKKKASGKSKSKKKAKESEVTDEHSPKREEANQTEAAQEPKKSETNEVSSTNNEVSTDQQAVAVSSKPKTKKKKKKAVILD
ncbi:uncharacterized protein CXQ87_003807 [Candidozyma duobushaemuli]|uniref:AP-3 complex subunit delta n=1 Tax=Candidozyma duobushaemuli TaxID=1231522 RepID=A0A2V1AC59_9ASCO|nr:uncharacterized protein CXQ87_003807 [[Candida] duobushaemulonis]PVH15947.1 hypothetical protein CXQ87_003807 [[Candida] duobushaemulonis]